jgi:hypothetical protein
MAKDTLSASQIRELLKLLRKAFRFNRNLAKKNPLASYIKNPQIPSQLTESLALHILNRRIVAKELDGFRFDRGRTRNDPDIIGTKGAAERSFEVKATAESAFQELKVKDMSADYIIWIHFGDFFSNASKNEIEIRILQEPSRYFRKPQRINLDRFDEVAGKGMRVVRRDIERLLR